MKKKYIIIVSCIVLACVIVGEIFYINRHSLIRKSPQGCSTAFNFDKKVFAAIPPASAEDQASRSDIVVQGEVCKVVKTYNDGDEIRKKNDEKYGKNMWVGGGTSNSQDVIILVKSVQKGHITKSELTLKKPISAYTLGSGDQGTFYISTDSVPSGFDGTLVGEYWPVTE